MESAIGFLLLICVVFILIVVSIPVSIAGIAYLTRKSKRNKITAMLTPDSTDIVPVRCNTPRQNDAVMKFTGFEFSGVLYIRGNVICVKGSQKNHYYEFDIRSAQINWVGTQFQNGLIQWFSLRGMDGQMIYVNVETGLFVFRIGSFFPSTREVYEKLFNIQNIARMSGQQPM